MTIHFHLVEHGDDFAFLATVGREPLDRALREVEDRAASLDLFRVLDHLAQIPLIRSLLDSGDLFKPLLWPPAAAYRFFDEAAAIEKAGASIRVPSWWQARPRVQVGVTIGGVLPGALGAKAVLDFTVAPTLDGEPLTPEEWQAALASTGGLVRLRGKWVEVDGARLGKIVDRWQSKGECGVTLGEGMRLCSDADLEDEDEDEDDDRGWSRISAGPQLRDALSALRGDGPAEVDPGPDFRAILRPYQQVGVNWLYTLYKLGLGACLADDMGLGKSVQVLALLNILRRERAGQTLLILPASLLGNWQSEAARFSPSLRLHVAHPSASGNWRAAPSASTDLILTTYGSVERLPWATEREFALVALDEAQAIKNPGTRQTRTVKALVGRARLALTGTPVENRLTDLWSIFDFLNPGLLGSVKQFSTFTKRLRGGDSPNYEPLRRLIQPYILRRMKSDKTVISDLPDKTEMKAWCSLSVQQAACYQKIVDKLARDLNGTVDAKNDDGAVACEQQADNESAETPRPAGVEGMSRRGVILTALLRLKQVCNHPPIDEGETWAESASGKLARLRELAESIAACGDKLLVFTQFREATGPLYRFLEGIFGKPGLVLHGDTPVTERTRLVQAFQTGGAPFFVLSVKAGGTGLTLTAAAHVVHFDRWWNPAVEDQATDRTYRIGQHRNVLVHKFVVRGTVEEKVDLLIEGKRGLSRELLSGEGEVLLTEMGDDELINLITLDLKRAMVVEE